MLVVDQLKKNDAELRVLAVLVAAGFLVLLAGVYYVQILSYQRFVESGKDQTFRTVRIPAVRGKILDRNGIALAENRAVYNIVLYLDELRPLFREEYERTMATRRGPQQQHPGFWQAVGQQISKVWNKVLRKPPPPKAQPLMTAQERLQFQRDVRFRVASNVVQHVSDLLQVAIPFTEAEFHAHYEKKKILPMPILKDLNPTQLARFEEQPFNPPGLGLEILPVRTYPHRDLAAHLLGHLTRDESASDDPDALFDYKLQDFRGVVGLESTFNDDLRGKAGVKSVVVNRLGYRQKESVWTPAEPGKNVVLTLDQPLQRLAEQSLRSTANGTNAKGAVVVLNCRNGDILAMASNPGFDPNIFLGKLTQADVARLNDEDLTPQINRATQGIYPPGSIFKIVTGLASLEAGVMQPNTLFSNQGYYVIGREKKDDLAPPGLYDFKRAFLKSSNSYFIEYGLRAGLERILELGEAFFLGQKAGVPTHQNSAGMFPTMEWISKERKEGRIWTEGNTANVCIGQELAVTPIQMAVMTAAIANGGKVYWPRLVQKVEAADNLSADTQSLAFPVRVRGEVKLRDRSLQVVRDAMLADVEDPEGTGKAAFVSGFRVCGKTGTAEVTQGRKKVGKITWFAAYAPYENPKYAVVVMVENGSSGGGTCAPVAQNIFKEIHRRERQAERNHHL